MLLHLLLYHHESKTYLTWWINISDQSNMWQQILCEVTMVGALPFRKGTILNVQLHGKSVDSKGSHIRISINGFKCL